MLALLLLATAAVGARELWVGRDPQHDLPAELGRGGAGPDLPQRQINRRLIRATLQDHHIGLVLFMSGDDPTRGDTTVENQTCAEMGIRRLNYNLNGNGTGRVEKYIDALAELIRADRQGVPVLVHCETGASAPAAWSPSTACSSKAAPGKEAYAELLRYGHDPHKNPHLIPYLNEHMREVAEALVRRKLIDRVPDPLPVVGP